MFSFVSKKLCLSYLTIILFFVLGSPYILLAWPDFISGISLISHFGFQAASQYIDLLRPLKVIQYGMGLPLFIISAVGLFMIIIRRLKSDILLLSWIAPFYFISARMVYYITDSRLVPVLPFLCLTAALFFKFIGWRKSAVYFRAAMLIALLGYNLLLALSMNSRFDGQDVQTEASDWILENIPVDTKIGYARQPYWWAPYIHYNPTDRSLLERNELVVCGWDKDVLDKEKPPYFVATDLTFHRLPRETDNWQSYEKFREYVAENYRIVKTFNKELKFSWFRTVVETRPDKRIIADIYYQPIYILKRVGEEK